MNGMERITSMLTDEDRSFLKYEKRLGYTFSGIVFWGGTALSLFTWYNIQSRAEYINVIIVVLGSIFATFLVCNRINYKVNRDLRNNRKELIKCRVVNKKEEKSWDPGSGSLSVPILAKLFPKLWNQKMTERRKYYICTEKEQYEVDKNLYDCLKKDDYFFVHIAIHSEILVNITTEV